MSKNVTDRIKLYIITVLGVIVVPDPDNPDKEGHIYSLQSELKEAQSREMAEQMVREDAVKIWPEEQPWKLRAFSVTPIETHSLFRQLAVYRQAGVLAGENEMLE